MLKTPLWLKLTISVAALAAAPVPALSQSQDTSQMTEEERRGYDIAARSDRSDNGFGNSNVSAEMVLRNAAGQESRRKLSFQTLERENEEEGDKSLVIFESPRDVEGTALLSHANILTPDDQWLFLPALQRVKRISSANKSGPFVGSEFAFEDFTASELNKYTYRYVGEDTLDGMTVDVVERFPRYDRSGYTRQIAYIDQDVNQLRKVDFYDRKNSLLKTLTLTEYRQYGDVWRAQLFSIVNHQTSKETDIIFGDYDFSAELTSSDFDKGVLTRIR